MKDKIIVLIIFILAISTSYSQNLNGDINMENNHKINDAIDVIMSRKSVRNFKKDTVSHEDLTTILKAAMAAPTAVNKQPWSFIVVTDREILDKLADTLPYAKMLFQAPSAIIVCAHPDWASQPNSTEYAIIDCSLASMNILLAAEALGLGAVWTAAYPRKDRIEPVRSICNIPDNVIPLNVIPIGYPTGEDKPKDKFKEDRIHWNKF